MDVGTDAGELDQGVDTGIDLGSDLAVPDLGIDGGVDFGTDTGMPDADSGADLGASDAGAPDTGAPDSGLPETIISVSTRDETACAVGSSGHLYCWGGNLRGALGIGSTDPYSTAPVVVPGIPDAEEVVVAGLHACVRRASGEVDCWGSNTARQLGAGSAPGTSSASPVVAAVPTDIVQMAAGEYHTCGVRVDGTVVCWGSNTYGELGDGTSIPAGGGADPTMVTGIADAVQVACGSGYSCARRATGAIQCWGHDSQGALGDGISGTDSVTPVDVVGIDDAVWLASTGGGGCAIRASGATQCWGGNSAGTIGDGTTTARPSPVDVVGLTDAVQIDGWGQQTCAVHATGTVSCWGAGPLGDGTHALHYTPVDVVGISDALQVIPGSQYVCVRRPAEIDCWGRNTLGELGDGTTTSRDSLAPVVWP